MSQRARDDNTKLAGQAARLLARALPALLAAGEGAVTGAAAALWAVLGEPLKERAAQTLRKLAANPEDSKRLNALEAAVEDLLEEQAELRARVAAIVAAQADATPSQRIDNSASERNININAGGDISGGVFNTGDNNTF